MLRSGFVEQSAAGKPGRAVSVPRTCITLPSAPQILAVLGAGFQYWIMQPVFFNMLQVRGSACDALLPAEQVKPA